MKAIVIGGTGLVGAEIVRQLRKEHEVAAVGRSSGDLRADMEDPASLEALFKQTGPVDAVISAAGEGLFAPFDDWDQNAYARVLKSKVMGQVNIVRTGHRWLNPGGSFTLTSGAVTRNPMPGTAAIAIGAGAIDAFVATVALELEQDKRINAVSLSLVKESAEKFGMDSTGCIPVAEAARSYGACAFGTATGQAVQV